jgi:hypothetical protein
MKGRLRAMLFLVFYMIIAAITVFASDQAKEESKRSGQSFVISHVYLEVNKFK